jgi:cytoplasmic iron level regulating protein YaaA (DUF328/UPF0246 family)
MKIIISPAKKMKKKEFVGNTTTPIFSKNALTIANKIKKYDFEELQKAFKCSPKISQEVYNYYHNFNSDLHPALYRYDGLQYMNIDILSLSEAERSFLNENLLIADALYGLLKPTDLISQYRLDYNSKFDFVKPDFYKKKIKKVLTEPYINLCSNEYSAILPEGLAINIIFIQNLKGVSKSYSTNTKIARGKFVKYLANEQNTSIDVLTSFKEEGYVFDEAASDESNIIYYKVI